MITGTHLLVSTAPDTRYHLELNPAVGGRPTIEMAAMVKAVIGAG